jgi:hypothetical protein
MPTMSDPVVIELRPRQFTDAEAVLASHEGLTATTFRYGSGVAGLHIANEVGRITLLPFQGQQIWDATFHGRSLTMGSMFDEPVETDDYLRNYGAFLLHCGATAMGNPGPADTHPLHGELPNARYQRAQLLVGRDEGGAFMALTGMYRHAVAFTHHYVAQPTVTLGARSSRIRAGLSIRNLKHAPMELMYLAHVNFRPVDGARIIDTVPDGPRHMRVRATLPGGRVQSDEHARMIQAMQANPALHRTIDPERRIDPELVLALDCTADEDGWAHSMQVHPDGTADYISHRPDELSHAVRWFSRNIDQDALGLLLPATAEADGFTAEKAKGNIRILPAGGSFECHLEFGALDAQEAAALRGAIEATMASRKG